MAILYGLIAVVCALICGSVAHAATAELGNKLAVGFFATTAVVCLFAGLDWMDLLPEM